MIVPSLSVISISLAREIFPPASTAVFRPAASLTMIVPLFTIVPLLSIVPLFVTVTSLPMFSMVFSFTTTLELITQSLTRLYVFPLATYARPERSENEPTLTMSVPFVHPMGPLNKPPLIVNVPLDVIATLPLNVPPLITMFAFLSTSNAYPPS